MPPAIAIDGHKEKNTNLETRSKRRFPLAFLLVGLAILGAVIYLVYANTQTNAAYYMTVSELHTCANCATQSVRVAGVVQDGSIVRDDAHTSVRFTLVDGTQTLQVAYSGVVPDIFKAGVQVVVEGRYSGQGPFQAQTLLAKCPSKFQNATPTTQP
ncbi:cytochrome c maturation protein CcmE [Ktedonospora formicarum]|uniref:Cytochrome C biogenesis protein CcmE n=1 Tax=Ktedonospora formicarum TaxID=2778364 RepID=A0A8J3MRE4_9CHLR|nr:cytochrome c maturation protein CcmE [Ktedonospora formicarum]GHO43706.1 cytochrome C biogenesis protein CcmE [Ktedonospora formicarum]